MNKKGFMSSEDMENIGKKAKIIHTDCISFNMGRQGVRFSFTTNNTYWDDCNAKIIQVVIPFPLLSFVAKQFNDYMDILKGRMILTQEDFKDIFEDVDKLHSKDGNDAPDEEKD